MRHRSCQIHDWLVSILSLYAYSVNTIAIGCDDSTINMYDLRAVGKVAKFKDDETYESVQSLSFSNSGRLLFSSYANNKIKVWDTLTQTKITNL